MTASNTLDQIAYLDRAAGSDAGRSYKRELLAALDLRPGHTVVDVGCGPGTDLPALAAAVGAGGSVVGVDHDPGMVEQARTRTAAHPCVTIRVGDAHALPLDDAVADRARSDRVLQHLADPAAAVRELRRVLRPGGLVTLAEPDWDTLAIDAADLATSRAYTRFIVSEVVRNACVGRGLARLLHEAGFVVESVAARAVLFRDHDSAEAILRMPAVARRAWQAGALDEPAARAWLAGLEQGPFLAAVTFFTVVGRVPEH
ncbi:methyltransferase domain-containing protein [Catellatospora sp. NPDC049609]|uniref:methyltransferase domain-containing protein n=1 Tax=Catellatospora sp. NPDC049609 TaxID=3155505 RepID=UPI00343DCD4D